MQLKFIVVVVVEKKLGCLDYSVSYANKCAYAKCSRACLPFNDGGVRTYFKHRQIFEEGGGDGSRNFNK